MSLLKRLFRSLRPGRWTNVLRVTSLLIPLRHCCLPVYVSVVRLDGPVDWQRKLVAEIRGLGGVSHIEAVSNGSGISVDKRAE